MVVVFRGCVLLLPSCVCRFCFALSCVFRVASMSTVLSLLCMALLGVCLFCLLRVHYVCCVHMSVVQRVCCIVYDMLVRMCDSCCVRL